MPYVKQEDREWLNKLTPAIAKAFEEHDDPNKVYGRLNYLITRMIDCIPIEENYNTFNSKIGLLECIKQEFYRRRVVPYEDIKVKENGDVY